MKKILCLALTALMLLSCACAAQSEPEAPVAEEIIESVDMTELAAKPAEELRLEPIDKGYTRGGKYANMTWRAINAAIGTDTNNAEPFYIKEDNNAEYSRRVYFTFDLTKLEKFDYKKVFFSPSFTLIDTSLETGYYVQKIADPDSWSGDTLTWNKAPKQGERLATGVIKSLSYVDLTDAVNKALDAGETKLSFVMKMKGRSGQNNINSRTCRLVATTGDSVGSFTYQLVEDEAKNKAIWDYAENLYNEWYARYLTVKAKQLPEPQLIESDADEWTKTVYSAGTGFGNWTENNVNKPYKTRTYEALDDLGDYTDYDREMEYDVYGGWMNPELRQESTGFFYSKKIGDRWWLIDPLGYPCFIRAIYGPQINFNSSENQKNEALKLYGSDEKWQIAICRWLKDDLYFNTITAYDGFSNVEDHMLIQRGRGSFAASYGSRVGVNASVGGSSLFSENNTMPIMEPGFVTYCNEVAKGFAADCDNPWTIGYTTDNELPMDVEMLGNYLTVDYSNPVNHYSYAAAWTWFCNMTGKEQPTGEDITPELSDLFRGFVWDRYFNVVVGAIRKYDPNHMIMGTRFLHGVAESEWVCRFASEYLDCITVNWYGQWEINAPILQQICSRIDLPIVITEFYTKAMENHGSFDDPSDPLKNTRGAGWIVRTQQDRGDFYENYTLRLLECKYMVGWQWHMYIDNDDSPEVIFKMDGKTWKDQSNIDANKGIVDNWHRPYEELCASMKQINENVYRLIEHFDAKYAK